MLLRIDTESRNEHICCSSLWCINLEVNISNIWKLCRCSGVAGERAVHTNRFVIKTAALSLSPGVSPSDRKCFEPDAALPHSVTRSWFSPSSQSSMCIEDVTVEVVCVPWRMRRLRRWIHPSVSEVQPRPVRLPVTQQHLFVLFPRTLHRGERLFWTMLIRCGSVSFLLNMSAPVTPALIICVSFYPELISRLKKETTFCPALLQQKNDPQSGFDELINPGARSSVRTGSITIRWLYWPRDWSSRPSSALLPAWFIHSPPPLPAPPSVIFITAAGLLRRLSHRTWSVSMWGSPVDLILTRPPSSHTVMILQWPRSPS